MTTNLSKQDRPSETRVFIALELPAELRTRLAGLRARVGSVAETAKWVAPELLHITVRFLGEIPHERLVAVNDATRATAALVEPFELRVGPTGVFPHARNPRVLWTGLEGEAGLRSLQQLQGELERRLIESGFGREEKPFSPHITLARVRPRSDPAARAMLGAVWSNMRESQDEPFQQISTAHMTVMRSELGAAGPRYTPLSRHLLGSRHGDGSGG